MAASDAITRSHWRALGLAFIGQTSNSLGFLSVAPLAPLFQSELGLTKAEVGFFASAVYLSTWIVLIPAGTLADRFGAGKLMTVGQVVMGIFLAGMSLTHSLFQAVAIMAMVGAASAAVSPGVTKSVVDWFPVRVRATAMGIKQAATPVAGVAVASTLPALGLIIGWRSALATVGFFMVAGGLLTALFYREPPQTRSPTRSRTGMRAGLREVIGSRPLWTVSVTSLLFAAGQFSVTTYVALYFNETVLVPLIPDVGARVVAAGGYLALCNVGGTLGRVFWGAVSDRLFGGGRLLVLTGVGVLSVLMSVLLGFAGAGAPLWLLSSVVFAYGATASGWGGLYLASAAETVGPRYAGTALGFSIAVTQLGNLGGPPFFGLLVDRTGSYLVGWLFVGVLFSAGSLLTLLTRGGEKGRQEAEVKASYSRARVNCSGAGGAEPTPERLPHQ